jgi:pimeloyl-ACP methyl ester carboxylesterase
MKLFHRKSGSGQPLIILHGLFGISDNWAGLAKQWAEDFTVYAVDLRNHGQSPHSEEWNYTAMSEDIIELMGDEKLHDVVLLGHSMGGKVGMRLAIDYPAALSKLIVADIAPRQSPPNNTDVVDALLQVDLNAITSRKDAEAILRPLLHNEGTIQFLLKNLYWKTGASGEKRLDWRFNLDVISKKIDEVYAAVEPERVCETETLFIRGSKSSYITPEDEAAIATLFPNSSIHTVEDAGHWVHADQPQEVYALVRDFASR